jgi:hypothetical protein
MPARRTFLPRARRPRVAGRRLRAARALALPVALALAGAAVQSVCPAPAAAQAPRDALRMIGLTEDGALARFALDAPAAVARVAVTGVAGTLLGIDVRPADRRLYGVTTSYEIYTIDPASGTATPVSTLTTAFDGGPRSGFDFNPQADRLRLVAASGQDLRVNVALGAAAVDGPLTYARGDRHAGTRPAVTAAAYTAAVANAPATKLFDIDADLDVLALQDPPNDGVLVTVGPLGVDFAPLAGFDVVTDASGADHAYAVSGSTLYAIDLATGAARRIDTIGDGRLVLIGLAVEPTSGIVTAR